MIKETVKTEVVRLRAEGNSYSQIAKSLNLAKQTVVNILRSRMEELSTLRSIELESVIQEQRVTTQGRISILSDLYHRLRESIEKEDLSLVPLEKRIALFLKMNETMRDEVNSVSLEVLSREEQNHQREERLIVSDRSLLTIKEE